MCLMKNKRIISILLSVLIILLIPFIAMLFTNEVNWSIYDFFIMGVLLLITGLFCELLFRRVKSLPNTIIVCGIILFALFLVWVELAVGIFGTRFAGS